ncbi:hypothetical protein LOD99_6545 [Oopsacas minuta]|uniref:Calponin-homology (CH) domain-containing protein n=1 Tax=Oopsacas minuta TaxID=111878 RepID=A0AAV7JLF7_9METZ|nr:hypothetical protein LOD99_6545 [Oopsacas minuta]
MLLRASAATDPIYPSDKTPEHVQTSRRRFVTSDSRDITDSREGATVAPDGLRSMHYYKNWANGLLLSQNKGHIDSLVEAFSEGRMVLILTQLVMGDKISGARNDPALLKHKLANTHKCIEMVSNHGIVLEGVTPEELVNGKKIPIKMFCQALEKEHKKRLSGGVSTSHTGTIIVNKINSSNPPTSVPDEKLEYSRNININTTDKNLRLEDIAIETPIQTEYHLQNEDTLVDNTKEVSLPTENKIQNISESDKVKLNKKPHLEIPSHKASNKFLPSPPRKHVDTDEREICKSKKSDNNTEILRIKETKSKEETIQISQKQSQLKQRRYSPLDITKLAGKLFDAFNTFSNNDLPDLAEETTEESISIATDETMDAGIISTQRNKDTLANETVNRENVKHISDVTQDLTTDNLTVLPPLSLDDLSPEVGDEAIKKDTKRILRKTKRQATSIDSADVIHARNEDDVTQELNLDLAPLQSDLLLVQDSVNSDIKSTEAMDRIPVTANTIESNTKHRKKDKNITKENHRLKSIGVTEAHSVEDMWSELQRLKTTVRTHHAIASRFAQDYPVMRRCFESQNQTVRKLERVQHTRSRNIEKELQDKLALMEGYLVQTMRENADLRSKVWGLTTRLTQLEKSGSSRPSSILSLSEVQHKEHPRIQDISKIKRSLKLKKFFGEEPPPLLEEIPTSFTHDTSREDDEVV